MNYLNATSDGSEKCSSLGSMVEKQEAGLASQDLTEDWHISDEHEALSALVTPLVVLMPHVTVNHINSHT